VMFFVQSVAKRIELTRNCDCRLSVVRDDLKVVFAALAVSSWLSSSFVSVTFYRRIRFGENLVSRKWDDVIVPFSI
jgi:hypothetical protein